MLPTVYTPAVLLQNTPHLVNCNIHSKDATPNTEKTTAYSRIITLRLTELFSKRDYLTADTTVSLCKLQMQTQLRVRHELASLVQALLEEHSAGTHLVEYQHSATVMTEGNV